MTPPSKTKSRFAGEGAGYIRVQGIRVGDDLSGLADLFVRAVSLGR